MSNALVLGTITCPIANVGPTAALYIGSPKTSSTSTSLTVEYEESKLSTYKIVSTDGVKTISLDTITSGNILYLGCNYQTEFVVNGNTFTIGDGTGSTTDGGFIFMCGADITTLTIEAQLTVETTVTVGIYGE